MNKIKKMGIATVVSYLFALVLFFFYFKIELDSNTYLHVFGRLIFNLIGFLCIYIGSISWAKSVEKSVSDKIMRSTFLIGFILYCILLCTVTLFDTQFGRNETNIFIADDLYRKIYLEHSVNLIPFKTILFYFSGAVNVSIAVLNLLGNFCMFMPCAFLFPIIVKRIKTWKSFFIAISGLIIVIEVVQLVFMCGTFDIDDYILNVGGALVMYGILKVSFFQSIMNRVTLIDIKK